MKAQITADESHCFQSAVADVVPLANRHSSLGTPCKQKKAVKPHRRQAAAPMNHTVPCWTPQLSDAPTSQLGPETPLFHASPGLQQQRIKRLKQGGFPIERQIDLHGYSVAQSHGMLHPFLLHAQRDGLRLVLVIHGKGEQARLKNALAQSLPQHPTVLAFCSAAPKHGGTGAAYVLLRAITSPPKPTLEPQA